MSGLRHRHRHLDGGSLFGRRFTAIVRHTTTQLCKVVVQLVHMRYHALQFRLTIMDVPREPFIQAPHVTHELPLLINRGEMHQAILP